MVRDRPTDRLTDRPTLLTIELLLQLKNCSEGSKKVKKVPIVAKLKTKDVAVLSHNQSCNSSLFQSQLFRVCRCYSHVYYKILSFSWSKSLTGKYITEWECQYFMIHMTIALTNSKKLTLKKTWIAWLIVWKYSHIFCF